LVIPHQRITIYILIDVSNIVETETSGATAAMWSAVISARLMESDVRQIPTRSHLLQVAVKATWGFAVSKTVLNQIACKSLYCIHVLPNPAYHLVSNLKY